MYLLLKLGCPPTHAPLPPRHHSIFPCLKLWQSSRPGWARLESSCVPRPATEVLCMVGAGGPSAAAVAQDFLLTQPPSRGSLLAWCPGAGPAGVQAAAPSQPGQCAHGASGQCRLGSEGPLCAHSYLHTCLFVGPLFTPTDPAGLFYKFAASFSLLF